MSVDSTLLLKEIDAVLESEGGFYNNKLEVRLYVNKQWLTPVKVEYYSMSRDYSSGQLGDIINLEVQFGYGDFAHDIIPYRDDIMVELEKIPLGLLDNTQDMTSRLSVKRYKGVLSMSGNDDPTLTGKNAQLKSKEDMNQIGLATVSIQLVDEIVYKMMMVSCGETFRKVTTRDIIVSTYTRYAAMLGGNEDTKLKAIDFAEGYNKALRHQVTVPDGLPLKDLPAFVQNKEGGVYATGLGRYIQNQVLHVFPLYDTSRYGKNTKVLNLINVPNERYKGAENTFKDSPRSLTVLATGDASAIDEGLAAQVQYGNGLRFGNANSILQEYGINKDNRMLVDKASNVSEVVGDNLKDGLNNMRWSEDRMTSNPYKQYSDLARRQGLGLKMDWINGNPDLIYPGMPVKFQTISNNLIKTYHGVVLGVNELSVPSTKGVVVNRHATMCQIGIFINRFLVED